MEYQTRYRRKLPHIQSRNTPIFLTFRLAGSRPKHVLKSLRAEQEKETRRIDHTVVSPSDRRTFFQEIRRQIFLKWDRVLDKNEAGPSWLGAPAVADLVREAIEYRHPEQDELICYTIMPNHVHQIIIHFREDKPLYKIMGELLSFTGKMANRHLKQDGAFWQSESFDHVIRHGRLSQTISYILNNPVKAGLVRQWQDWPYSWVNPRYRDSD